MTATLQKKLEAIRRKKEAQNKKLKQQELDLIKRIKSDEKKKLKKQEKQITEIGYYIVQNFNKIPGLPTEIIKKIEQVIQSTKETEETEETNKLEETKIQNEESTKITTEEEIDLTFRNLEEKANVATTL